MVHASTVAVTENMNIVDLRQNSYKIFLVRGDEQESLQLHPVTLRKIAPQQYRDPP